MRYDPPGYMSDFDRIPGQRGAWHNFVSASFDVAIGAERMVFDTAGAPKNVVQYYNAARHVPDGPIVQQAITWNAFPKELIRMYGRDRALIEADRVVPIPAPSTQQSLYNRDALDEYCEWHVVRDPDTQKIVKVTFTSEPVEYWQAMFGGSIPVDGSRRSIAFRGSRRLVLQRYRELVSPDVRLADLIAQTNLQTPYGLIRAGEYNPFNKWNTTHGVVHLTSRPNTLGAEIRLGADATVLYRNARGRVLTEPEPLICCANFGGADRNSDPTIGATVNALARTGAMITLANPVGLYMDHIDLAGWSAPPGVDVRDCVRIVRGRPRMIERLIVEVPKHTGYTVGDIRIGGEPIRYGGHIAECITVKLVGAAAPFADVKNRPLRCANRCCVDPLYPTELGTPVPMGTPAPAGTVDAFVSEGGLDPAGKSARKAHSRATPMRMGRSA